MGLPKGRTNNPKGRPRGKPNLCSKDIRESLSTMIKWYISNGQYYKDFLLLKPYERIRHIENVTAYAISKLQSIDMSPFSDLERLSEEQLDKVINQVIEAVTKSTTED